jgi:3-hydroxyacyl-[acyl-carrier-protein] dehydratase
MSLTPHGPGFSFLDAFEVLVEGKEGRGTKWLDPKLAFFADHFPGRPLMPGVLLIECAAQAAGALWASVLAEGAPGAFTLAQVLQFKMQRPVGPGRMLVTEVVLESSLGGLGQFGVTLRVEGMEVARGRVVLSRDA